MDQEITIDRLLNNFEGVIYQINQIIANKDIEAAKKAMHEIEDIVNSDNPEITLDDREDENYDHVLHELLSKISGVIERGTPDQTRTDGSSRVNEIDEQVRDIDNEIDQIDSEIESIYGAGRNGNSQVQGLDDQISNLQSQLQMAREEMNRLKDDYSPVGQEAFGNLFARKQELEKQIGELSNQKKELEAQGRANNTPTGDHSQEIANLRSELEAAEAEIKRYNDALKDLKGDDTPNGQTAYINTQNQSKEALARRDNILSKIDTLTAVQEKPATDRIKEIEAEIAAIKAPRTVNGSDGKPLEFDDETWQNGLAFRTRTGLEWNSDRYELQTIEQSHDADGIDDNPISTFRVVDKTPELTQEEQSRLDSLQTELNGLLQQIKPDKSQELADLNSKLEAARSRAMTLGQDLRNFKSGAVPYDENAYAQTEVLLLDANNEVRSIEAEIESLNGAKDRLDEVLPDTTEAEKEATAKEIADIDSQINDLRARTQELAKEEKELEGQDELQVRTGTERRRLQDQIRALEARRTELQEKQAKTKEQEDKESNLTPEQKEKVHQLLARKKELLDTRKNLINERNTHVISTEGNQERYDLGEEAKRIGDAIFKTHDVRKELEARGVTREDFLKFYNDGIQQYTKDMDQIRKSYESAIIEQGNIFSGPNGEKLNESLSKKDISNEDKSKILEMVRKNFMANPNFANKMKELGFDKELTSENIDNFQNFVNEYVNKNMARTSALLIRFNEDKEARSILVREARTIQGEKVAIQNFGGNEEEIKAKAEADKSLRDEQIKATIFGNPELEQEWNTRARRFVGARQNEAMEGTFTDKDGQVHTIKFDTIGNYKEMKDDAHFLNLDDYKNFLEITTAYDAAEKEYEGGGLDFINQNVGMFRNNPLFADKYQDVLDAEGQEAANKFIIDYINEKKEYVKSFHGFTNRDAVKYANLKTAGSTLVGMKPVKGDLPVPVKMGNAVTNIFRFVGLRAPSFHYVDKDGNRKFSFAKGAGTLIADALVVGAGAVAIAGGPVTMATWAGAYAIRGGVTAGNVIAANRYYKKHKEDIDNNLPTLDAAPNYVKEVVRRDYYREKLMEEKGQAWLSPFRMASTALHAKFDRLPFFKKSRENTENKIVSEQQARVHDEIDKETEQGTEAVKEAQKNQETRQKNYEKEARSAGVVNEVMRNGGTVDDIDAAAARTAANSAVKSRGGNARLDVSNGDIGDKANIEQGRYVKAEEQLDQTTNIDVSDVSRKNIAAATAVTEEQHYEGEKKHRDFWNRAITAAGTVALGMAVRYVNGQFTEKKMIKEGQDGKEAWEEHIKNPDKKVPKYKEVETTDYDSMKDLKINDLQTKDGGLNDTWNNGNPIVQGQMTGNKTGFVISTHDGKNTIELSLVDKGVGYSVPHHAQGFSNGSIGDMSYLDGVKNLQLAHPENYAKLALHYGLPADAPVEKVAAAALNHGDVFVGNSNAWFQVTNTVGTIMKKVQDGFEMVPQDDTVIFHPGVDSIPPEYADIFSPTKFIEGLGKSAALAVAVPLADDVHEQAKPTHRTSTDALGRDGGRFEERNPILAQCEKDVDKVIERLSREKKKAKKIDDNEQEQDEEER